MNKKFDIAGFGKGIFGVKFNNENEFFDFLEKYDFHVIRFCNKKIFPQYADFSNYSSNVVLVDNYKVNPNYINWNDYMEEKIDKKENKKRNKLEVFKSITDKMYKTYEAKNNDYGDSFTKVRNKYPNSIVIRLNDKLNRLESLMNGNKQMVSGESIKDTLIDMANYCIMELIEMEMENERREKV